MARAPVSKTGGWGFESLHSCQAKPSRRRFIRIAGAAPFLVLGGLRAWSQASRSIKFVVPFPPGGAADLLVRVLAQQVGTAGGVTTVIEDRPGAASIVGTEYVSRAAPDGNTVLIVANSFVIHPFFKQLNYDPLESFAPLSWLANSPQVIVVNSTSPYRTLTDLIDAAHAKPGQLTNASVGPATTQHIAFELLKLRAKITMIYVPFNGNGPAINELLGGHVDTVMANYSEVSENVKAGNLRALAVGSRNRLPWMPDVPTVAESGYEGYEVYVWFGLLAPAGTPAAVVAQLSQWADAAMLMPELKPKWDLQGLDPVGKPGADLAAHLRQQRDEYGRVIHEANIQGE
jgi:tripartite-type tricarboxylate transporter receptor subunit TctC